MNYNMKWFIEDIYWHQNTGLNYDELETGLYLIVNFHLLVDAFVTLERVYYPEKKQPSNQKHWMQKFL